MCLELLGSSFSDPIVRAFAVLQLSKMKGTSSVFYLLFFGCIISFFFFLKVLDQILMPSTNLFLLSSLFFLSCTDSDLAGYLLQLVQCLKLGNEFCKHPIIMYSQSHMYSAFLTFLIFLCFFFFFILQQTTNQQQNNNKTTTNQPRTQNLTMIQSYYVSCYVVV